MERDFAAWTGSRVGQACMATLRSTYVNNIMGPTATNDELRYREGQRSLIGAIETLAAKGRMHG